MNEQLWAKLTLRSICGMATVLMELPDDERRQDSVKRALGAAANVYLQCGLAAMQSGVDLLSQSERDQLETAVADLRAMFKESDVQS